jgi:hypothetical protein
LKDCREVLHDGSNEIVAQMLAFMNRVDGILKQIETQVNKIDEVKSSLVDITRKVSSLNITVKELKEKNKDIENSTPVMSDCITLSLTLFHLRNIHIQITLSSNKWLYVENILCVLLTSSIFKTNIWKPPNIS